MRPGAKRILSLWFLFAASLFAAPAQDAPSEYQLKAAFLFNFAKFVDWPAGAFPKPDSPFVIGVLGENPFEAHLENTLRHKTINGRPIVHRLVKSTEEARHVHVLYISASETKRMRDILKELNHAPVLTVGETEGFVAEGGMIGFVREGKKIRFQIDDESARAANLKINSKLLSLSAPPAK